MLVVLLVAVGAVHGRGAAAARRTFPVFQGGVPVLLYHRVEEPSLFAAQMERLHELGFTAISLDTYMRFMRGESVSLPPRPILLTFDDGRLSAWLNAEPVLARYGWSATMYVATGLVGGPGYLSWDQLRQMQSSGHWQIDEHAGDGHVQVIVDAAGHHGPFYANEIWSNGSKETFAHYTQRVGGDIAHGARLLAQMLPGWSSHGTFAVPFSDYGQRDSNDPRIEPWLSGYLQAHFHVVFVQRDDAFTTPGAGFANRIPVTAHVSPDELESRLLAGLQQLPSRH